MGDSVVFVESGCGNIRFYQQLFPLHESLRNNQAEAVGCLIRNAANSFKMIY